MISTIITMILTILHITSMAGTWMSIVYGFGGMRVRNGKLYLSPFKPESWSKYSFNIVFRDRYIKITVSKEGASVLLERETL